MNDLFNVKIRFTPNDTNEMIKDTLTTITKNLPNLFSYILFYDGNETACFNICLDISNNEKYNTICREMMILDIYGSIVAYRNAGDKPKGVVSFGQPPVDLLAVLYKPLIHKLALEQSDKWKNLEYEDALQMCNLMLVMLYNKDKYISKGLLRRSFNNYVLMSMRHDRNKPKTMSLDTIIADNDGEAKLEDIVPDVSNEDLKAAEDKEYIINEVFNRVKKLLCERYSERQFNELFRDYSTKNTTSWSRKKIVDIKKFFAKEGITYETLIKEILED